MLIGEFTDISPPSREVERLRTKEGGIGKMGILEQPRRRIAA